ncbi:hypothetical protein RND61_01770 [Streptomyces sp. TRM76323]|uniref:Integral membrane protein n=1 Tax=Streptomyces tamarix TaxID=3078565 RepID=A0ABU3QDJ4_9ACTN|nr:hypothetical protein [Streptomyces tamarix]MDT9680822.1 hypothetical protein [Streptomyces tamarix]
MPERPEPPAGTARAGTGHRRPADPVEAFLHRYRELCERAVDPLEIAAGPAARGVTDRAAARFRHRDAFSLAEELYARVPRGEERGPRPAAPAPRGGAPDRRSRWRRNGWVLAALLPGAACGLALAAHAHASGPPLPAATGAAGLAAALVLAVRRGPLRAPGRAPLTACAATALLLLCAAYGDGLLGHLVHGGPDGPRPPATAPLLALALAVVPAAGCARLSAVRARRLHAGSRNPGDFTARARPLFLAVAALYAAALTGLLAGTGTAPGTPPGALVPAAALGTLLFLARLLAVHGLPHAGSAALAATAAEVPARLTVLVGRLPGHGLVAVPVRRAVKPRGTAAVPGLLRGTAALALPAYAAVVLARASAHARP